MKNTEKILRMARKKIVIMSLIMITAILTIAWTDTKNLYLV